MQSMMTDQGVSAGSEASKSGRVKMKRAPGQQHLAVHLTKGTSWCEIDDLIRGVGEQITVSSKNKGERTQLEEVEGGEALAAQTSHEAGRARAVRELNIPRGGPTSAGKRSATEILEACSCAKSDTR